MVSLKNETETENKKIDGKIQKFSEDLNLTKGIIRKTENKLERNLFGLNRTMIREFIQIFLVEYMAKKG